MSEATRKAGDDLEQVMSAAVDVTSRDLPPEEQEKLSKALFPDTHTNTVEVLGKERVLRPTPIRVARKIYSLLRPTQDRAEKQVQEGENAEAQLLDADAAEKDFEDNVLKALSNVALAICEFYGSSWDDVKKAVENEEVSLYELEDMARTQSELNSANDFLLQPLRMLIRLLQAREIGTLLMERYWSTSIMRRSVSGGTAPLQNSSTPILQAS